MSPFRLRVVLLFCLCLSPLCASAYESSDLETADTYYGQGSYQLALNEYGRFLQEKSTDALAREVSFKWADCVVKAKDPSRQEQAQKMLEDLVASKDHDQWWAEAGVTLASVYIERDPYGKNAEIKSMLDDARNYWAGSSDIKTARPRFIAISFMLADFITTRWGWYNADIKPIRLEKSKVVPPQQPANWPLQVLFEEILKVATSDDDKARALYSLGMAMNSDYSGDPKIKAKAVENFEKIIKDFPKSEWVDDAYYQIGMGYENQSDFVKSEEAYRKFLGTFRAGESQWVDDVKRRLEYMVNPQISVSAYATFTPGSQIQFAINRRNIKQAQFKLYRLDLVKAMEMAELSADRTSGYDNYQDVLRIIVEKGRYETLPVQLSWNVDFKDDGKHMPYSEQKGLAELLKGDENEPIDIAKGVLPAGAYLLMATTAGGVRAYDLIMVSDLAMVSKVSQKAAVFFVFDAKSGKPAPGATVKFNYSYYDGQGHTYWEEKTGQTDEQGLLKSALITPSTVQGYYQQHRVFAAASFEDKQAFVQNSYYDYNSNNKGEWWLYAFSDRPAYRPGETVSFKGILRQYDRKAFVNPTGLAVKYRIYDPQGNQVKEGSAALNPYGAFDDSLVLNDKAVLGEYRMDLYTGDGSRALSSAVLFRLEEYKLPEFVVRIHPEKAGEKDLSGAFRLGDKISVEVNAQYYFGGPVAEGQVEYLVYQGSYSHTFRPERKYPWYYEDFMPYPNPMYDRQLIKQEKITTDAQGKAYFTIETPKDAGYDLQYQIEARVVDKSRREIVSSKTIKVTKNTFFAYLEPKNNMYRPGDKAQVTIKTLTANDEPVVIDGKIAVIKNTWRAPVVQEDRIAQPEGYNTTEVITKFVKTNERGEAVFEFEPGEDGYYTVEFTGYDNGGEVKAQTNVFVCSQSSKDIGYRYSGLQIITEKDTYQTGETLKAMIVAERPDTWVLFSNEADDIHDARVIHLEGSVKLIEIPVTEDMVPNIFLNALSADQYQLKVNSVQVIVPPVKKFINLMITSDKESYGPQEEGRYDIVATDADGKPVSAQLTIGITDAAVYYIHDEYASDIRQFFYGDKRYQAVQTQASFYQRPYLFLTRNEKQEIVVGDELKKANENGSRRDEGLAGGKLQEMDRLAAVSETSSMDFRQRKVVAMNAAAPQAAAKELADKDGAGAFEKNKAEEKTLRTKGEVVGQIGNGESLAEPEVRTDFRSTVIWQPAIVTDAQGRATVTVKFPDSLTTWRATARAVTADTAIGTITHEVISKKDLIVRLQAPRFFTERDSTTISAIVNNNSSKDLTVRVTLDAAGVEPPAQPSTDVMVPAGGEKRVDWSVKSLHAGTAQLTVKAQSSALADAMSKNYPVIPHGIEKFLAQAVVLKGAGQDEQSKEFVLNIPKERIKESTQLQINLSPSMAANLLDALPYLADYPYGCVEQTMSRFLPAVIVRKSMRDLGLSAQDVEAYISDVMEPRGDPQGHPQRRTDTTYSKIDAMTKDGLKRLADFQHSDGGWGWWKDGDSDRFMSAYVLWGLSLAREAGVSVDGNVINRAVDFLQKNLVEEENDPDMLAWMLHALAQAGSQSQFEDKHRERLWQMRDQLNPYARALFAIGEFRRGKADRYQILAQNLINGVDEDAANQTAHWGESGINYRWSEGGVEATAFVVKALSLMSPQSPYLEQSVKWLTLNRRGARWKNTRDTAIAILGLTDYLKATRELAPEYSYQVYLNGKVVREGQVNAQNALSFDRMITIPADGIVDGDNKIRVVLKGDGSLYASAYVKYFTLEEGITKAGNEVFVQRTYYKQSVQETLLKGYNEDWTPIKDGDRLKSGDRVRVDVTLEAKNNYEYLLSEDYKPAGFEAVALTSGYSTAIVLDRSGRETKATIPVYQEFRDQKAAFFINSLKQGKYILRYELRAEVPGEFHAMPNQTHAMYVPEIRANSDEIRVSVTD